MAGKAAKRAARKPAAKRPSKRAPKPTGRPTKRTPALVEKILERIGDGTPLMAICREEGMPALRTVYDWIEDDSDLSARFAHARKAGYDMIAYDALRIADTPMPGQSEKQELLGVLTRENEDGEEESVVSADAQLVTTEVKIEDMLGHRKLQVEARLKLLAKWDSGRYGERLAVDHDAVGNLAEELKAARLRAVTLKP